MSEIFKDILPAILQTKEDVLDNESDYNPYLINRALSHHLDCVMYANEMNIRHYLEKKMQFMYLLNSIRAYKRPYQKWLKKETNEDIQFIQEHYDCSEEKAKDILMILDSTELEKLRNFSNRGGRIDDKHQRTDRSDSKKTR